MLTFEGDIAYLDKNPSLLYETHKGLSLGLTKSGLGVLGLGRRMIARRASFQIQFCSSYLKSSTHHFRSSCDFR